MNDDILRSMYEGTISTDTQPLSNSDEYRAAREHAIKRLEKIFSTEYTDSDLLLDDVYSAMGKISFCESRENFVLGWKLGAQFTLASLSDPDIIKKFL